MFNQKNISRVPLYMSSLPGGSLKIRPTVPLTVFVISPLPGYLLEYFLILVLPEFVGKQVFSPCCQAKILICSNSYLYIFFISFVRRFLTTHFVRLFFNCSKTNGLCWFLKLSIIFHLFRSFSH